jgi:hypothetical protein
MKTKLAVLGAAVALLLALTASAGTAAAGATPIPDSFVGMSPQNDTGAVDYELMREAGIRSVRLPMYWSTIQEQNRFVSRPDFDGFDKQVKLAAEEGISILPFILGTPEWVAPEKESLPVSDAWQRSAWRGFLRDAEDRYGPYGSFWEEHTQLDYLPIRRWEIWNEPNIVTFSLPTGPRSYAVLIREAGRVLHGADPGSKVIVGGLFGRPLQVPPNVMPGAWLSGLYRQHNVKPYFDGVALHPYVADAGAMRSMIRNLRRVMAVHHDGATPLFLTELGWGSDSFESRWERGPQGQVRELREAMSMLLDNRRAWRIAGIWWFSWTDVYGNCQFCDSAGLLTSDREAKPSWYLFNSWTGSDPDTVPRAAIGD